MMSIRSFKFYTKKGERLGIFLRNNDGGTSQIEVYRCSLADQFSKKVARQAFEETFKDTNIHYSPTITKFPNQLTGKEFYAWCEDNYWKRRKVIEKAEYTYLKKGDKVGKVLGVKFLHKMDG